MAPVSQPDQATPARPQGSFPARDRSSSRNRRARGGARGGAWGAGSF